MNKAPDAFRTISEVAAELDLPQHVLRFWESRFPQIKPMKRGGGRRYYRPDDVELLRGIRHLLYGQGYTIRGVQRILREQGPRFVQTVWQEGAPQPTPSPEADAEAVDAETEIEAEAGADSGAIAAGEGEVGAPVRPADDEDDAAAGADAQMGVAETPPRREPYFERPPAVAADSAEGEPDKAPPPDARVPPLEPSPADAPARPAGLSPDDRTRLEAALEQLVACRRLLDDALAEGEPAS